MTSARQPCPAALQQHEPGLCHPPYSPRLLNEQIPTRGCCSARSCTAGLESNNANSRHVMQLQQLVRETTSQSWAAVNKNRPDVGFEPFLWGNSRVSSPASRYKNWGQSGDQPDQVAVTSRRGPGTQQKPQQRRLPGRTPVVVFRVSSGTAGANVARTLVSG